MSNPLDNPEEWTDFTGPDGTRYSFSHYHPTDHWPWEARCRKYYGGWRQHLHNAWHFHRKQQLRGKLLWPLYRILCPFGRHSEYVVHIDFPHRKGFFVGCHFCRWERSANEAEWFHYPGDGGRLGG